ncbi:MAG: UDP-N-acetylmuramoyl-L-alanine--D-glutamate ligase [Rhodothermia bacterium]|nr:UDP-N-acetylmuramoyl-L-alanine--D-glutamate ligase [Rhodothermia bacterium]
MTRIEDEIKITDAQQVTVLGAGKSGRGAAALLARMGTRVFVSDGSEMDEVTRTLLRSLDIPFEEGGHSHRVLEADCIVTSPGIPSSSSVIQSALERSVPVISEIELAYAVCRGPIIAVTGSNGKTTTTSLLGHVFEVAGRPAHVAGNIGRAFSEIADSVRPEEFVILEVSSFQLDHVRSFRPKVSVLLNITPDHLDRYGQNFEAYAASKYRIFENQREGDFVVYNADDAIVATGVSRIHPELGVTSLAVSLEAPVDRGGYLSDDQLIMNPLGAEERLMQVNEVALRGRHNLYNSLAAAVAARATEIRSELIRESLSTFEGVPHRLELVREVDGVKYVNDSKATNVNSLWYALESFPEPVVLIAGGRDKGNEYDPVKELVREKVAVLIAIGESAGKVHEELGDLAGESISAKSLEEALEFARLLAKPGSVVLLSPACASFDMFDDYVDRGDTFRRIVQEMN